MSRRLLFALLVAFTVPVSAQVLDCSSLANNLHAEPEGYAQQCLSPSRSAHFPAPAAAPGGPRDPTDTGFAYNMRAGATQGLHSHVLNNLPGATLLGNPGANFYGIDFDPTGTTLYAVQVPTAPPYAFGTINTTTGAFTPIANVTGLAAGASVSDLVIDPVSGDAFLSAGGVAGDGQLYSFNLTTGVATPIGAFNVAGALFVDMAMNCDGDMYAHDIASDALYSVDMTTGAATLIGPHGIASNFAQGMDFDNSDGTLYAAIYVSGGNHTYGTFNLATGAITPLSSNSPLGEWELAIPTTCGTGGLEAEPNDNKAEANPVTLPAASASGVIVGNSTGNTGTGATSLDYFLVSTAAQATPGFYRHRLIITSDTAGHTGTIRGLSQDESVINPTSDVEVQASSAATTPARFVQWYTSEAPADIYFRVAGTGSTTSDYTVNYEVEPVTPVAGTTIDSGVDVAITTVGETGTDTDMWVYDADREAIVDFGNDDEPAPSSALQSRLTRTFAEGSYFLAISNYNVANNLAAPSDDRFRDGNVLDFPGAIANSSTTVNQPLNPSFGGTDVAASKAGPYDVVFVSFDAEPAGPEDNIFANGFECEAGFPGCEGGTPGVYTNRDDFLANVQPGFYEENFASVPGGAGGPSMNFSGGGFAYTVTATGGGTNELYNDPGLISHDSAVDALVITFTGSPVTAIGGNFWASDIAFVPTGTDITITLSDGTIETYTSTGPTDFRGFITPAPITSITIDAPDVPVNAWATMDNIIVGQ